MTLKPLAIDKNKKDKDGKTRRRATLTDQGSRATSQATRMRRISVSEPQYGFEIADRHIRDFRFLAEKVLGELNEYGFADLLFTETGFTQGQKGRYLAVIDLVRIGDWKALRDWLLRYKADIDANIAKMNKRDESKPVLTWQDAI